jgi:hypothetical protein
MFGKKSFVVAVAVASTFGADAVRADLKDGDVNIGVSGSGQLVAAWNGEVVDLPEIGGPLFGFGLDEPGFFTIDADQPNEDIFLLEAGHHIVLEVIALDDALKGWTPGFASVFDDPGETWDIGAGPFDEHPFWHIDSTDGGFVAPPGQTEWNATFRLLDTGTTGYAPSDPVIVTFAPEPGTLSLILLGGVMICRRGKACEEGFSRQR